MTTQDLLTALDEMEGRDINLTDPQKDVIKHPGGPGIVTAGPGSGKTEVLTLLLLRLLLVDEAGEDSIQNEHVPAKSVMITTFTEKAAKNLRDRVATYQSFLVDQFPELSDVDISQLRIGTLHELCNDIMQEYGWEGHQNVRLMDKYEQSMFIRTHHSLVQDGDQASDFPFWAHFEYLFSYKWDSNRDYLPNKWQRADALQTLFRSIVEDRVSISDMVDEGGVWNRLADAYHEYVALLADYHRCDFAHLLSRFLTFLDEPLGDAFLTGEDDPNYEGLQWVLVDEYQDTNRIQERIYFKLAERGPHNLVVVGDDDQALYRFRGGSVECMVTFEDACDTFFDDYEEDDREQYPLVQNFRSHPQIVGFLNNYITSFDVMDNGRIDKPDLEPQSNIGGDYEAVGVMTAGNLQNLGQEFAETVRDLVENGVVDDPNQCCLLLSTTKETSQRAGPYVDALRAMDNDLEPYNPRNKAFFSQEEVQVLMGALLEILDPNGDHCPSSPNNRGLNHEIDQKVTEWSGAYHTAASQNPDLRDYVQRSQNRIQSLGDHEQLDYELLDITYYLMSLPPFTEWKEDPFRRRRLGKLTGVIEAFQSTPDESVPFSRGEISTSTPGQVHPAWLRKFYYIPIASIVRSGTDDVEFDDIICPPGRVPVMTIHQSKGLEFPFVFVGTLTEGDDVDDDDAFSPSKEHYLEDELAQFPLDPERSPQYGNSSDRALRDIIRKYYVSYSRAQYGLVLMASESQLNSGKAPMGPNPRWLTRRVLTL